ncbi:diaminopimelate epimerase [Candidatus Poriferisocius sp.]|uniref:diaminopimelate epimerase n=1 Tax=Candidatus Poriferisocius sp. TaxID=3101276 RepID=UPI003B0259E2
MQLTKHHGLGNDFLVALPEALPADAPAMAQAMCHRTRGVGADGLILGLPGDPVSGTDVTMVLFNADGSRAEMSGNGIRCLAQAYVLQGGRGRARGGLELRIGTDAGVRTVQVDPAHDPAAIQARVDMGPVSAGPGPESIGYPDGLRCATADVGNPHLVIQVPDARGVDAALDGAELSRRAGGVNVEFISPHADGRGIDLRVWERGVGATEACGTGACAAAQAAHNWGLVGSVVAVSMPGGDVVVELGDTAVLVGPAVFIATVDCG